MTLADVLAGDTPFGVLSLRRQWAVVEGDCREVLAAMPDGWVQCVVTSPPYWGLRDYGLPPLMWGGESECQHQWNNESITKRGHAGDKSTLVGTQTAELSKSAGSQGQSCRLCGAWRGSLGLEPTPELYIEHLAGIFGQVRRVLRDDGTMWVNIAGCYANTGLQHRDKVGGFDGANIRAGRSGRDSRPRLIPPGLKPKDWVPIPWMLGMALQADGWWLRSPIIWAKGLPFCEEYSGSVMPESVRDRPTTSYEYVLLLTKSKTYFYDAEAVREKMGEWTRRASSFRFGGTYTGNRAFDAKEPVPIADTQDGPPSLAGRNLRSVWAINPSPFPGAHFATFPPALVEPCIKAGTSERGCCPDCGKAWERVVESTSQLEPGRRIRGLGPKTEAIQRLTSTRLHELKKTYTLGWLPGCDCEAGDPIPCIVLDPFIGSGTTIMVALRLGRRAIGIDLSPEYCQMARQRIVADCPMFNSIAHRG